MSLVSQAHIDAFRRDGFVVVADVLSAAELETFGAAVDAAVAARTRHDRCRLEEKTPYEQSFQQCLNLWEDHPGVRAARRGRPAAAAAPGTGDARVAEMMEIRV